VANAQSVQDVIAREQNALAAETRIAGCPPYVAANDLNEVLQTPYVFRTKHPAAVRPLSGARGAAFIVACPSLGSSALWVGTHNKSYRQDYLQFLNLEYGLNLTAIPRPFDVDHLYNQARGAIYKLGFLRTALVAHVVNRSHGAGPEKDVTINEELREPRSGLKQMDEIACMKYFGFLPPLQSDPRDQEIEAYAIFAAAKLGLDADAVRNSVRYLRQKASTPWARRANG
jgi:hypothetical protein